MPLIRPPVSHLASRTASAALRYRAAFPPLQARPFRTPPLLRFASTLPDKPDLVAIDTKWKDIWYARSDGQLDKHTDGEQAYVLAMFPYPSGSLHIGHLRVYTISDVLARFKHMCGYNVLHPIGWDAFGLPAENAAIERGVDPAEWTEENIRNMKEQLRAIGAAFDWERELKTCSPDFYKQTQRLFLMLHEKGLAYQAKALVNYDPIDKTVLANEQVDANGCSWRSGAKVQQLELKQWFLRITAFKEALLKDLSFLDKGWPERVLSQQRHWLGRSSGARIKFEISAPGEDRNIDVFTTRADTLHGVQYLALSLTHPLVQRLAETHPDLKKFIESAGSMEPDTKAGFKLPEVSAINPLSVLEDNLSLPSSVPVFAAPYVLAEHGEGAVMGVPGHDSRDLAFWKENSDSRKVPLVVRSKSDESTSYLDTSSDMKPFTSLGVLSDVCGSFSGLPSRKAAKKIVESLKDAGGRGETAESWRLRDWLISRQRYWGAPIPIIHCDGCGAVPVPAKDLPVQLPAIDASTLKGKPGNPLDSAHEWLNTSCPSCGGPAKRDTDTMDTFVDSSWYNLRFLDSKNEVLPFSPALARPVDIYVGGVEHAILHLLYARFMYKFLTTSDLFTDEMGVKHPEAEPFLTLLSQGMVHGKTYTDPNTGHFIKPNDIDLSNQSRPVIKGTDIVPTISYEKMSKSKHNGVDPTTCINKYGSDTVRAHILFSAPVSEVLEWDESKIVGIQRWFNRLWRIVADAREYLNRASWRVADPGTQPASPALATLTDPEAEALLLTDTTIKAVTHCLEKTPYGLNTVISGLTKLTNTLSSLPLSATVTSTVPAPSAPVLYLALSSLLRMLAPIAPAYSSELWHHLQEPLLSPSSTSLLPTPDSPVPSLFAAPWPRPFLTDTDVSALQSRGGQTVAVQINGKTRFTVQVPRCPNEGDSEKERAWVMGRILEAEAGRVWLRERNEWEKRKRVVVVPNGRVVNVVF